MGSTLLLYQGFVAIFDNAEDGELGRVIHIKIALLDTHYVLIGKGIELHRNGPPQRRRGRNAAAVFVRERVAAGDGHVQVGVAAEEEAVEVAVVAAQPAHHYLIYVALKLRYHFALRRIEGAEIEIFAVAGRLRAAGLLLQQAARRWGSRARVGASLAECVPTPPVEAELSAGVKLAILASRCPPQSGSKTVYR